MTARRPGLAAVAAEYEGYTDHQQVTVPLGDVRSAVALINGLHAELRQALAALDRIEMDLPATDDERALVTARGARAIGQLTDAQITAAAARHTIGGSRA